ncbi:outer membrane beta-barrel family protein [Pedobacter duraquae]|uniref:Carboxypeptidase family protein n=1 Tax=Pedobacter duraquae TaxID=425511 RepID=A0A4R6INU4_9SPHI|nr:outer membrane beta-barrel family protein [Pedobacter duraquae]TDO23791.1 carboxypeptidase family protein [Pedobacter duraquae]
MKKILSSGLLMLCACLCYAQIRVSGKVTDSLGNPLSGASISIAAGASLALSTRPNAEGIFYFAGLHKGSYLLKISEMGFVPKQIELRLERDTSVVIQMQYQTNQLESVDVQFKRALIETLTDRRVFNAEGSAAAIGTDLLELLAKIPGIQVKNGVVSLLGRGAAGILVDGRQISLTGDDLAEYLRSLSASAIAKVEMISNPPAGFDAQGSSGLVNIILTKKSDEGLKSSVNSTFSKATFTTLALGGNLNYKKGKMSINASVNFRKGSLVPVSESTVFYKSSSWNTIDRDRNYRTVPSGLVDLAYSVSGSTDIGASLGRGSTDFHSTEVIRSRSTLTSGVIDQLINSDAQAKMNSSYYAAGLFFKHRFKTKGNQIGFNADYFSFNDDKKRNFDNTTFDPVNGSVPLDYANFLSGSGQQIDLYTLRADVEQALPLVRLSYGGKLSLIRNNSSMSFLTLLKGTFSPEPDQFNTFSYKENTSAVYASATASVGDWDLQMGLRAEYTANEGISAGNITKTDYIQFFPTLYLNRPTWTDSKITFSYGRRIERPPYRKLNPFRWYTNQFSFTEGNTFLSPFYTNNLEFSHNYKGLWNVGLSLSSSDDAYGDVNFTQEGSILQVIRPMNFIGRKLYLISNSITLKPVSWLESINQVDVFYNRSTSSLQQVADRSGSGAYLSSSNQLTLTAKKTWLADLSLDYYSPTSNVLGRTKGRGGIDLGVRTFLADKKIQVALLASDVLKTRAEKREVVINEILQRYYNYNDSRQIRLNVRYNFGNQQIKAQDRKGGNEEERRRSN